MMLIAAVSLILTSPVVVQNQSEPVAVEQAAPAAVGPLTIDTPIETLVANPKSKAALEAAIPGITAHPAYDQFKTMSLVEVQPMSGGVLTDEQIAKVKDALAAMK